MQSEVNTTPPPEEEETAGQAQEAEEATRTAAEQAPGPPAAQEAAPPAEEPPSETTKKAPPTKERPLEQPLALSGDLRVGRSGPVRVLLWVTGLALLAWIARGLVALLGYRHPTTLTLGPRGLELEGERRFMGLSLGKTARLVPLASIQLVDLVGRSGLWALVAALVGVTLSAAIGTTLVLWGFYGAEPSWIMGGLMVIAGGVVLDALAYLWSRLCARRGLADLELRSRAARMRLRRVDGQIARRLVQRLARGE
jgi:hypothetical protein